MLKLRRPFVIAALVLTTAGSLAACAASTEEEKAPTAQEINQQRRGALKAVVDAAYEAADLTETQKADIEVIRERLLEDDGTRAKIRAEMRATASEIVRDGTTDTTRFESAVERAAVAIEQRIELSARAVADIHALLTPEQRAAVAEVLRERIDERWGRTHRDRHEGMKNFAAELSLSREQVVELEKLRNKIMGESKRLRPTAEELYGLCDAFETPDFVDALDAFHAEKAPLLRERLNAAGSHADTVLAILDTDQRDVLADIIEHGKDVVKPEAAHVEAQPSN